MTKVALVTGASTGIGRQIAARLAARDYVVFGTSRKAAPAGETLDSGTALPGFTLLPLDVTDDASVQACVAEVLRRAGRLDVLVNNAGVELLGALEEISVDEAKWLFETNVFGVMRVTSAVLPHMRRQRSGVIINISSIAGLGGSPFQGVYCASKGALELYSESLWYEVAPFGVRVALVEPWFFKSDIARNKRLAARTLPEYAAQRAQVIAAWDAQLEGGDDPLPVAQRVLDIAEGSWRRLRSPIGRGAWGMWMKSFVPDWMVRWRIMGTFGLAPHPADTASWGMLALALVGAFGALLAWMSPAKRAAAARGE
jgi:NAD(P)-dependent dehydrogenase (short-subunit alcohol dehydrogenase family)